MGEPGDPRPGITQCVPEAHAIALGGHPPGALWRVPPPRCPGRWAVSVRVAAAQGCRQALGRGKASSCLCSAHNCSALRDRRTAVSSELSENQYRQEHHHLGGVAAHVPAALSCCLSLLSGSGLDGADAARQRLVAMTPGCVGPAHVGSDAARWQCAGSAQAQSHFPFLQRAIQTLCSAFLGMCNNLHTDDSELWSMYLFKSSNTQCQR